MKKLVWPTSKPWPNYVEVWASLTVNRWQYVKCCVKVQGLVELELELASSAY